MDAILTASPYYNKPTQEGQYQHFKAIAEAVDKPLVLYNVAGRTGGEHRTGNAGASGEDPQHHRGKRGQRQHLTDCRGLCHVPESFLVFSGDDAVTIPVIALGGVGIISVGSNEIPKEMSALTAARPEQ